MTKNEFLKKSELKLINLEKDYRYNNYSKQLLAYKLGADISKTYNLNYMWQKTLLIISSSCFLLNNDLNSKIALKSLYKVAIALENISEINDSIEQFDVDFLRILSALCYDISGYQANAYCIARKIQEYRLATELDHNLDEDNFIIQLLLNALLKKIPAIKQIVLEKLKKENISEPFEITLKAFNVWSNQILDLSGDEFLSLFEQSYSLYLKAGNIYISQLILLFVTRIKMYNKRSINLKLKNIVGDNAIWKKYIKLLSNDYFEVHGKIKGIEKKKSVFEFWTSQIRAIDDGLLSKDESFVVQMPTSAGKTFIAELFILKHLINTQKNILYISPFRALASEKVSELGKYFSYLGYKVTSSTGSYEYEPMFDSVFDDADVFVFTPEKADSVFRTIPDFYNNIAAIVVDEGHIVGDLNHRAALAEMLLIKLKIKYPKIKTLFISAVMPDVNAEEYARWLSNNKENILRSKLFSDSDMKEEWEPTRKNIGYFEWTLGQNGKPNGKIQFTNVKTDSEEKPAFVPYYLRGNEYGLSSVNNKPETTAVLGIKLAETGNTLIFCGQVIRIKYVANKFKTIFQKYTNGISILTPDNNKESYFYSKSWYGEEHWITKSILYGIGIHFGDMAEQVRAAVENDYKNQKLKIMLCTNTVGQGVNFPIKNIIFYDITVGYKKGIGQIPISYRDFWNIIGRAGRAEKETEGNIIFIINSQTDKKITKSLSKKKI
ncbi:MAG: DEAD/DEAH box helicase [Treponema sp.]|nr:DEAD/DEAH box helicase [Treponema sp.]